MPRITVGEILPNGEVRFTQSKNGKPASQQQEQKSVCLPSVTDNNQAGKCPTSPAETRKRPPSPWNLLPDTKRKRGVNWLTSEERALVEFLAKPTDHWDKHNSISAWPAMDKTHHLWTEAAQYIAEQTGQPIRQGSSVRSRVTHKFRTMFCTAKGGMDAALKAYNITPPEGYQPTLSSCQSSHISGSAADTLTGGSEKSRLSCQSPSEEFDWKPLVTPSDKIVAAMEILQDLDDSDKVCFIEKLVNTIDVETMKMLKDKLNKKLDVLAKDVPVVRDPD